MSMKCHASKKNNLQDQFIKFCKLGVLRNNYYLAILVWAQTFLDASVQK
jgi:hypothetical protein